MTSKVATSLGHCFKTVLRHTVDVYLGLDLQHDGISKKDRVSGAIQNSGMESWVYVTCFLNEAYINSFEGANHKLWLNGACIPLTPAEADAVHAALKCQREDDGDGA